MKIEDFKLEEYFAKHEFSAKYLLCSSDCESFSIKELLALEDDAERNFKEHWLGYTENLGSPSLRNEISNLYGNIDKENVIVFSGAEEGIFVFMNTVLTEGDTIIVQFPSYQSLYEIARSIGCKIVKWEHEEIKNWELDLDLLEDLMREDVKCLVLNFPHNPTGYIPTMKQFERIINIAEENNVLIFSDEVYRFLEYDEKFRLNGACSLAENAVSLGVMSKSFGLAGLRIGWIATKNLELIDKLRKFKNYTTICNSAPSEFLAELALRNKDKIISRNLGIIKRNLNLLDEFFNDYSHLFKWIRPKAGSIGYPRLLIKESSEKFCLNLLKEKNVLLMPSKYYNHDDNHFRIGFGRKNMPEALEKLKEYLEEKY